jgi:hypothetical protein
MKRPQSASRSFTALTYNNSLRPQTAASKQAAAKPTAPPKPRPEWNANLQENPHKISRAEVLQRKLNAKSKHETAAREELQAKLEALK